MVRGLKFGDFWSEGKRNKIPNLIPEIGAWPLNYIAPTGLCSLPVGYPRACARGYHYFVPTRLFFKGLK